MKIGHQRSVARRTGDQTATIRRAGGDVIARELGKTVEVERAAERVHEIELAGAEDGVVEAKLDRAAGDSGLTSPILTAAQQQGARAHLDDVAAGGDLAGQVHGDAVHNLEVAFDGSGGRT